jgi:Xaa-Pro aminopeptidase
MILSNEPGYYKSGEYGIRIENLLIVEEAKPITGGERVMQGFETLTLAPIDHRLIDSHLLTRDELNWLDAYHQRVLKELTPLVDAETQNWLKQVCAPLT